MMPRLDPKSERETGEGPLEFMISVGLEVGLTWWSPDEAPPGCLSIGLDGRGVGVGSGESFFSRPWQLFRASPSRRSSELWRKKSGDRLLRQQVRLGEAGRGGGGGGWSTGTRPEEEEEEKERLPCSSLCLSSRSSITFSSSLSAKARLFLIRLLIGGQVKCVRSLCGGFGQQEALLPPQGDLRRHDALPLHHQQAAGAAAVPPAAEAFVAFQTRHDAVVTTSGAFGAPGHLARLQRRLVALRSRSRGRGRGRSRGHCVPAAAAALPDASVRTRHVFRFEYMEFVCGLQLQASFQLRGHL
ncbi:hypothetical protein EYF80_055339 [Liparis tanakae]|uniref:Uncharacterized protein n=1 Tax=Liparis tanakae TaxID=230148 RepID=A0A4Z2F0E5_9TELE|nr:hypothetical protein EYF80_055339 [Liparis tanakae]